MLLGVTLTLASAYALVVGAAYLAQDRMLLFPQRADTQLVTQVAERNGLVPWRPDGVARGWISEPAGATGTVLLLHGNAGMALDRLWYARTLGERRLRVILLEYPGYGTRADTTPQLASLIADADQAIATVLAKAPKQPLVLIGESLGAGIAAQIAARHAGALQALILITPWDSLRAVAARHYPWLPVGWLLKNPMDSIAALRGSTVPTTIVLAERDAVIPVVHGERLAKAIGARIERVRSASHNDWRERVDAGFWARVLDT